MLGILKSLKPSNSRKIIKKIQPLIQHVGTFEETLLKLSDAELKAKTAYFKEKIDQGASLDDVLPEAFAVVREAGKRTLGERHYDVQILGGVILHQGRIAEMRTGEGKTLVSTLPLYLNALSGKGAHLVTVNEFLAARDAEWMGQIYRFLNLSVGSILHKMDDHERKAAYAADITYGTNNEFGFDYLRDNMKQTLDQCVQRDLNFAIVDEVDSILVDEARTPLIISGPTEESTEKYYKINKLIPRIKKEEDYKVDEKAKTASLTEEGAKKAEGFLEVDNLFDAQNIELLHHVNQALKAHAVFKRDVDYVVDKGEVVIVDEFTGRLMPGRRYSEGLHQALEAKEGVPVANENQTLATITFQNYFRMYNTLSGMTGTAETEEEEFEKIYGLGVVVVPTNMPMVRKDHNDQIYKTQIEKYRAVIREAKECYSRKQPVLVGTVSIEKSELLSKMLKKDGIPHQILNARHHEKESDIISNAGQPKRITISTNMAGRGTDIKLGTGVADAGGLHVIGTERHESRRIDNQLRGRAGRQGDPGSSRFFLSLEDDLLRIFGSERIQRIMDTLKIEEDQPIEHRLITRAIGQAQKRVEGHHFDIRKHLLKYDDVMNQQREVIYTIRRTVLKGGDPMKEIILDMIDGIVSDVVDRAETDRMAHEQKKWEWDSIREMVRAQFGVSIFETNPENVTLDKLGQLIYDAVEGHLKAKEEHIGTEDFLWNAQHMMIETIDTLWKDHLLSLDHLKESVSLRSYAQKDPLIEYKKESMAAFMDLDHRIKESVIERLCKVRLITKLELEEMVQDYRNRQNKQKVQYTRGESEDQKKPAARTVIHGGPKVGRNDPCPCGSGKKYKKCHGKGEVAAEPAEAQD